MIFITQGGAKLNLIISIHLNNHEALEYTQKHALIIHAQRLCQAHPANSTGNDYLGLVQFDPVGMYFYSR